MSGVRQLGRHPPHGVLKYVGQNSLLGWGSLEGSLHAQGLLKPVCITFAGVPLATASYTTKPRGHGEGLLGCGDRRCASWAPPTTITWHKAWDTENAQEI